MQVQTTFTIEKLDPETENVLGEFELDIIGEFTPEERGSRGFYGEQMEPDTESQMEFIAAYLDGEEYELSKEEIHDATMKLWEALPEND